MIYEGTVTCLTIDEKGNDRVEKRKYIIENGSTFGDVEQRLCSEHEGERDLDVVQIKRNNKIREIANRRTLEDERVFIATVIDVFTDDNGNETETKYDICFYAKDMSHAHTFIQEYLHQGYNLTLVSIKMTKVTDVLE